MDTEKPFISYSQLFEDAVLFRTLGDIWCGYYIDVGAHDPVVDSVTKAFYQHGWNGINIEPIKYWHEKLKNDRPHDINLNVAVGAHKGEIQFYEVVDTGLSTANAEYARQHRERGFKVQEVTVNLTTLNDICAYEGVSQVQFLKIDVEGLEKEVLLGIDLSKIRPWIVIVEATEPLSYVETWKEWEPLLITAGYSFIRTDGLNRFYLANEHEDLRETLSQPLDSFNCRRFENSPATK